MSKRTKPALLTTSSGNDVLRSKGKAAITGLVPFVVADLIGINHNVFRAEVLQIYTIGGTTDPTIAASTTYTIKLGYPFGKGSDGNQQTLQTFSVISDATLSGVAATDRQNIYDALTAQINGSTGGSDFVTAGAGTGGTAMTLTDVAGYQPNRPTNKRGITTVILVPDSDGGGFADATHLELSTTGVYPFGVGTTLAADVLVLDSFSRNLSSGEFDSPDSAVAGQHYDAFFITHIKRNTVSPLVGGGSVAVQNQGVYVDDGGGTSTTNLAGYLTFRIAMEKLLYGQYEGDGNSMVTFFDTPPTYGGKELADGTVTTGLTTGAAGDQNTIAFNSDSVTLEQHVLGTQTILVPKWDTTGLLLNQDLTANDGMEIAASIETTSPVEYVVGTQVFSFICELTVTDITDLNPFALGLRAKEDYQADYNDYDSLIAFALDSAGDETGATKNIDIHSIIVGGAATQTDDTTVDWANAERRTFEMQVDIDGVVRLFIDEVEVTDVQTPAYAFTADEIIIPFCFVLNEAGDHGLVAGKWLSVADIITK